MSPLTRRQVIGGALVTGLSATLSSAEGAPAAAQSPSPISPAATHRHPPCHHRHRSGQRRRARPYPGAAVAIPPSRGCHRLPGKPRPELSAAGGERAFLVDLVGESGKVPIYAGMSHPILNKPYPVATFIHSKYGLGSVEVPTVKQTLEREHAVDAMRRIVLQSPGEITVVALGGLTNVAMAMLRDSAFTKALKGILFVGGRYASPGLPPSYNVLVDPEAAHVVFTSGVAITLVGADVISRDSILNDEDFAHIAAFNTPLSRFFIQSNDLRRTFEKAQRGTTGSTNPDPIAIATAINPSLALRYDPVFMQVELQGELTRGLLIYGNDIYAGHPAPSPNSDICVQASPEVFRQMIFSTLSAAG